MKHEPSRLAGLEVRKIEAEDGAWNIHAVHSAEFGSDCSPVRTKDGTVCVPREMTDEFDGRTFGDASCQLPAATSRLSASLWKCDWDPEFLLSPLTIERCPDAPRTVHAVGSAADAFGASDTGCVPDNRSDFETRLVGDALPASRFIAFEEQRVGRGKLRELYLSDGDRPLLYGEKFFDAATGQQCDLSGHCDGTARCVPDTSLSTYSDPACTKPVFTQGPPNPCRPANPPRRIARKGDGGYCYEHYFEVGARVSPGPIYLATPDGCEEQDSWGDVQHYELRPLPVSEVPIVESYIE